jgi:hypothetical protein
MMNHLQRGMHRPVQEFRLPASFVDRGTTCGLGRGCRSVAVRAGARLNAHC